MIRERLVAEKVCRVRRRQASISVELRNAPLPAAVSRRCGRICAASRRRRSEPFQGGVPHASAASLVLPATPATTFHGEPDWRQQPRSFHSDIESVMHACLVGSGQAGFSRRLSGRQQLCDGAMEVGRHRIGRCKSSAMSLIRGLFDFS